MPRGWPAVVAPQALVPAGEAARSDARDLLRVGDRGADVLRDAAVLPEDYKHALGGGGGRFATNRLPMPYAISDWNNSFTLALCSRSCTLHQRSPAIKPETF